MSQQLTEVGVGLSLDNAVQIIYGSGVPGNTEDSNSAKVGSSYSDVTTGAKWQKIADSTGPAAWVELAGKDAAIMVQHISSTGVILDQVPTQLATEFSWMVTAYNEADPANKYSALIHMAHNGTATGDATSVTYDQSSILRQGPKITGITISGTLVGAGASQYMNLHVSSGTLVTFIAYRMVKNITGSNTVLLGGANLANHIADGSVHLQSWQNTLLDGLNQSITSAQINTVIGATSNIQDQLNAKAASSDMATALGLKVNTSALASVATSGSYTDLTNTPASYSLPIADASTLGGIKVGSGLSIDGAGVLTAAGAVTSVGGNTGAVTNAQISAAATAGYGYTPLNPTGNVASATKLATARSIGMTGDATWSIASFDGTGNVTAAATLATVNANTGSFGSASTIPVINVDAKGRILSVSTASVTGGVSSVVSQTGAVTAAQIGTALQAAGSTLPYDIYGSCFGAPANGETVLRFVSARAFTVPANLAATKVYVGTAGTGATVWSVQKNGVQFATITIGSGVSGLITPTLSTQVANSFAVGDKFSIVAPATADATLADVDFAIPAVL